MNTNLISNAAATIRTTGLFEKDITDEAFIESGRRTQSLYKILREQYILKAKSPRFVLQKAI